MQVEFYKTNDNPRTINKTLSLNKAINIVFRQSVDEQSPVIIMNENNLGNSNYVYIPAFKRYYFISDVDNVNATLVKVQLATDLLMSYQDIIMNSQVQITATEKPSYFSTGLPTQTTTSKRIEKSDVTLKADTSLILTTVGAISAGSAGTGSSSTSANSSSGYSDLGY